MGVWRIHGTNPIACEDPNRDRIRSIEVEIAQHERLIRELKMLLVEAKGYKGPTLLRARARKDKKASR
jgi:hypothetical protein